jgi:hypothetical protein
MSFHQFIHGEVNHDRLVMPDLIRHPVLSWIPASAGMTGCAKTYVALYSWGKKLFS